MGTPQLVGRDRELAMLMAAYKGAVEGRRVVLVSGEAGVGKSRIVGEFGAWAERRGGRVLVGHCLGLSAELFAYMPIIQAVSGLARHLDPAAEAWLAAPERSDLRRLVPGILPAPGNRTGGEEPTGQPRFAASILGLFERASQSSPLVVVLEDLHWADQSTLDLLAFLTYAPTSAHLMLVLTVRPDDVRRKDPLAPYLAELHRDPEVARIELGRLSSQETRELIESILGYTAQQSLVDAVYSRSDGNPFAAEEVLAAGVDADLPETLRDLVMIRVSRLSEAAQGVLKVLAVAGQKVEHDLLVDVSGLDPETLTAAIREAVEARVLAVDTAIDGYGFRHVLGREAVYAELLPGERRRTHLAYARRMSASAAISAAQAAEIAFHWDRGREPLQALEAYLRAARLEMDLAAYPEAHRHFERAIELTVGSRKTSRSDRPVSDAAAREAAGVLLEAADAAYLAGRYDRAAERQTEALASVAAEGDPAATAALLGRLSHSLWMADRVDEAFKSIQDAVQLAAGPGGASAQPSVLAEQARMLMLESQLEPAAAVAVSALKIARDAGARAEECRVLITLGVIDGCTGNVEIGLEEVQQGLRLAEEIGEVEEITRGYVDLNYILSRCGRLEEALLAAQDGVAASRRLGVEWTVGLALSANEAEGLALLGRWAEADAILAAGLRRGVHGVVARELHYAACLLAARRGAVADADRHLASFMGASPLISGCETHSRALVLKAEVATQRSRWAAVRAIAADGFASVLPVDRAVYLPPLCVLGIRAEAELATLARASRDEGALDVCRHIADYHVVTIVELAERHGGPALATARAMCLAERRRLEMADEPAMWQTAMDRLGETGEIYAEAYAEMRLAEALLRLGRGRSAALDALAHARQVADRLPADPLRKKIDLVAARARLDLSEPHGADAGGQTADPCHERLRDLGLTRREIQVLELVSAGRTNRQIAAELFVAEKTAALHVSSILGKLSVSNRGEAAALAHGLGVTGGIGE
jgi:DNA-binding NarL/FixJ family response regulator